MSKMTWSCTPRQQREVPKNVFVEKMKLNEIRNVARVKSIARECCGVLPMRHGSGPRTGACVQWEVAICVFVLFNSQFSDVKKVDWCNQLIKSYQWVMLSVRLAIAWGSCCMYWKHQPLCSRSTWGGSEGLFKAGNGLHKAPVYFQVIIWTPKKTTHHVSNDDHTD